MKLEAAKELDTPPSRQPGVTELVLQLEADLRRLLGPGTRYVLVMAVEKPDAVHVQAVTDADAHLAMALMRYAQRTGFEALN